MSYEVKVVGLKEMQRRFDQSPNVVRKYAKDAMGKSVLVVLGAARKGAPVYQGQMRSSMESKVEGFGSEVIGIVGSPIVSPYPYPLVVEFGRSPGSMPPPSALERWVHLVLKVPTEDALGVAFVVARSIARRGIRARPFLHNAFTASLDTINRYFQAALREIVNAL